jgi:ABC-2 type transport system permease protein
MSAAVGAPPAASADAGGPGLAEIGPKGFEDWRRAQAEGAWTKTLRRYPARVGAFCLVELQKLKHDRTELFTRAVQPVLWLVIFGETFNRIHAIPTPRNIPYLSYLAPGIVAQSGLFIAIFYGIQIIWERDAGVLTKLLVTPTPRSALIIGKAFASGVRALAQVIVVLVLSAVLGVSLSVNPAHLLGTFAVVMLGSAFFSCLSMTMAGVLMKRDRLMGFGQLMTMPLFFASNALYPVSIMPHWLRYLSDVNPLSYEVDALRGLLVGTQDHLAADFLALAVAVAVAVTAASSLVNRLAR